ncbi:MAG: lysylphosphatidylglycerol synthase transmembrane domain-containing protein [Dehalococcoidales bacterium]|nr:lysylphosphatidylglycerol synthase transmembrane domain-containing protein [Dehalococcoidales bacterium]
MLNKAKLLGFVLTIAFLALAFWKVDVGEIGAVLSSADYRYVVPAAAITFLGYVWRTFRWKRILHTTRNIPTPRLFPLLMIGFMANNVLPARIGEFVRAFVLWRQEGVSKSSGLATIFIERLFDGMTLVLFLGVLSIVFPLPSWGTEAAYFSGAVFLVAVALIVVLLIWEDSALMLLQLGTRPFPAKAREWILLKVGFFIEGLRALQRRRAALGIIALSIVVWSFEAASYYLIVRGFGLQLPSRTLVLAAVFLLVMVNLGTMLPSAPGYVGTFQLFGVLALSAFGVRRELALSVVIVSHTMQYVLVTAIGLFFFWRQNLSLRRLSEDAVEFA